MNDCADFIGALSLTRECATKAKRERDFVLREMLDECTLAKVNASPRNSVTMLRTPIPPPAHLMAHDCSS